MKTTDRTRPRGGELMMPTRQEPHDLAVILERDGAQARGVDFTVADKLAIARELAAKSGETRWWRNCGLVTMVSTNELKR